MTLTEKYEEYFEEGREEGAIKTLTSLVSKGLLTVEEAAAELGVSVEEFQQKLQENPYQNTDGTILEIQENRRDKNER